MHVLVVGSSLVDIFLSPESEEGISYEQDYVKLHLGDKIPVNIKALSLGGNGANVSAGMTRLGFNIEFYTYLGQDVLSSYIKSQMEKENVRVVGVADEQDSSSLSLIFDFPKDRIIFSHHTYRQHSFYSNLVHHPDCIYLTSIGKEWIDSYEQVIHYAQENNIPIAFSPGSQQMKDINDTIKKTLRASKYIFINKIEAQEILRAFSINTAEIATILSELQKLGPKIVSVTNGGEGAYSIDEGGVKSYMKPFGAGGPEKTGAGDSYASAFLACHLLTANIFESMRWGSFNSHSVMQERGAQNGLLSLENIRQMSENNSAFLPSQF